MRISDWSSDVCSSDLLTARSFLPGPVEAARPGDDKEVLQVGLQQLGQPDRFPQIEPADDAGGIGEGRGPFNCRVAHGEVDHRCAEIRRGAALGDYVVGLWAERIDERAALTAIFRFDEFGHLRSEERRVGKESVSACRDRSAPYE